VGDVSDFQRGQIVGALIAAAYVTKPAILLGLHRAAVSKGMTTHTNHGKTSSVKKNNGRKPQLIGRDRRTMKRIVSKIIELLQQR
jgi:hypothetical protein